MPIPFRPSDVRVMSDVEAAWMGAIFEGEGSGIVGDYPSGVGHYPTRKITAVVANTDPEVLSACLRFTGSGRVYGKPAVPGHRPAFAWTIQKRNSALDFLHQIAPYSWKAQRTLDRAAELDERWEGSSHS